MKRSSIPPVKSSSRRDVLLTLLILLLTLMAGLFFYLLRFLEPVHPYPPYSREIQIDRGASTAHIASLLEREGLIHSALLFMSIVRLTGQDPNLQAGLYRLQSDMSLVEIMRTLTRGMVMTDRITIPEGFTVEDIELLFQKRFNHRREEFYMALDRVLGEYPSIGEMYRVSPHFHELEGYLFPDTYQFNHDKPVASLLSSMVRNFYHKVEEYMIEERAQELGLTLHQVVTIASLIEREAKIEEEGPLISGVIYNRLGMGMPLQVDATVLYVLPERKDIVLYRDLEVDSLYNTYRVQALPPGPISNPGLSSLLAAIYPQSTEYLYYVARKDGSHIFSRTYQEHLQAIQRANQEE